MVVRAGQRSILSTGRRRFSFKTTPVCAHCECLANRAHSDEHTTNDDCAARYPGLVLGSYEACGRAPAASRSSSSTTRWPTPQRRSGRARWSFHSRRPVFGAAAAGAASPDADRRRRTRLPRAAAAAGSRNGVGVLREAVVVACVGRRRLWPPPLQARAPCPLQDCQNLL